MFNWFRKSTAPIQSPLPQVDNVDLYIWQQEIQRAFFDLYARKPRHDDARDQRVIARIECQIPLSQRMSRNLVASA